MHAVSIRDAVAADHPALVAMNDAAIPAMNALEPAYFAWLVAHAVSFRVAVDAEGVAGFQLCLPSGIGYDSDNYRWFAARYDRFLYLDRIVVAERARNRGIGAALYADLHAWVVGRYPRIALEVNERPPNPGSQRFHERLGYRRVGLREYNGGANAVVMYVREV